MSVGYGGARDSSTVGAIHHRKPHGIRDPIHQGAPPDCCVCDLSLPDGPLPFVAETIRKTGSLHRTSAMKLFHRWRMQLLLAGVIIMGLYLLSARRSNSLDDITEDIDIQAIEREIDAKTVQSVTFQPPKEDNKGWDEGATGDKKKKDTDLARTLKYHRIWGYADKVIDMHGLFSDTPDVEGVLTALSTARIVNVDRLNPELFVSGTSEKWVITLEGGQKAMMKIGWGEEKGQMKRRGECNFGYEMYWAEIAAFHLHRILGFRNTPYVTGRKVDLRQEIFPVASPAVAKRFKLKSDTETCLTGKCYHCKKSRTICPPGGMVEASVAYWVPHNLQLWTFAPKYMPFSTPNIKEWKKYGFNNKTYCEKIRKKEPYNVDRYYHDLFDFAVIDFLMYHYDSKHYIISEESKANGLTVRLDHGRAFCAHDHDLEEVFLAPIAQCCIMRRETYWALKSLRPKQLGDKLKLELARDPLAPLLKEVWYSTIERRRNKLIEIADKCAVAVGGLENMLVG